MRRFTIIAVLALSVAACGGPGAETTTTTEAAAETATSIATTTTSETTAPETTTTTASAPTTTVAAADGGADCVVGEWDLDTDGFVGQLDAAFGAGAGGDIELSSNGGDYVIEFADGTMSSQRTDWGMTMATEQGDIVLTFDGSESGTWTASSDTLTVSISESDVSVDFSLLVDGELVSLPGGTETMFSTDAATVSGSGTYECDGDALTLNTIDDATGTEISSVLRRR